MSLAALTHPLDEGATTDRWGIGGPLTVVVEPDGDAVALRLAGHLDLGTVTTLRACIDNVDPCFATVEVDLADVTFVDSTGIGTLVQARRELELQFRQLVITNPSERARFVLDLTGLGRLIAEP